MSGDKPRQFPLPLSSLVAKGGARPAAQTRVATPQTATQNAARNAAQLAPSGRPGPPPAAYAQQRAQPLAAPALRPHALVSDAVRQAMVHRVARQGVKDELVLAAMMAVPRHLFIDEALASQAYIDASLPIGQHQTISQPYIVARMIELMRNGGALRRVLEIGTGCGYQAAVLARVAQEVYSIERIKALHELAKTNLRALRLANLRLQYGDGMLGLPQAAPFDGIILAAAGLEVPHALLEQLTIGGRLVAPVGSRLQHLQLISRVGKTDWISETLEACHFVPLRHGMV
ncbi:MAG: protein-L-isoaspartate(D-aspartate) O-methyltransferase [Pseudomonadota bacterium]